VPFETLDFDQFHTVDLPARLAAGNGALAAADLDEVDPIAFQLDDGRSYTYTPSDDGLTVTPGDDGARTVVELTLNDWSDFVWELRSSFALFYADRVAFPRGGFGGLVRWEPALRAAFDGQPIYDLTAPPPGDRQAAGRRALYVTYVPELVFEMIPPGKGYNDVLFTRDSGRVRHIDELRS
jgi:hypothetical protein